MNTFSLSFAIVALLLAVPSVLAQAPTLNFPLQAQLPPVARVDQYFEWTLFPNTFTSNAVINYAALDAPDWLSFDATSLTFYGQPRNGDTGNNFVIVQANATGSAQGTQSGFHCLVVEGRAPEVTAPLSAQLTDGEAVVSSAYVQSDGSIRIPPSWSFSIGFVWNTISQPNGRPIYYTAYRAGTTSLPNWLAFNNETTTFGGLAPTNTNYFEIDLYGSDYPGYGDVKQTFTVVIGTHAFILQNPLPPINATAKDSVDYLVPTSGLTLDGQRISAANLTSVAVNIPSNVSYLSYDPSTRRITGTLPAELPSTDDLYLPVVFTSAFNDTIVTNVTVAIAPQLFSQSSLPEVNVTGGQYFSSDLSRYLISNESSYTAAFTPASSSDWLQFNNASRTLSGTPPLDGQSVLVNITAVDEPSGVTESATLNLQYIKADTKLQNGKGGLSNGAKIAIAVVFGILGGLLLLIFIMMICRKYCHSDDQVDDDATLAAAMSEKGKGRATPMSYGRTSFGTNDSDRLSQAIAAAEASAAYGAANGQSKPKRIDLMRVFNSGKPSQSDTGIAATSSGRSLKEILGLTPSRAEVPEATPRQHQIIVVTDGDGYTYRPTTPNGPREEIQPHPAAYMAAGSQGASGSSESGSRSSFDSQQSSSLFYSEEADNDGSPIRRPDTAHTRDETPRSIPRRRRDFLPYKPPPRKSSAENTQLDNSADMPQAGGIRLVQPRRTSTSSSVADGSFSGHAHGGDFNAALAADAAIATAHLEQLNNPTSAASIRSHESRPHSKPRLIAFTSEKRGERSGSPPEKRFSSQKGIHSEHGHLSMEDSQDDPIDESLEDSPFDDNLQRYSSISQPYRPPAAVSDNAPIYFSTSPSGHQQHPSNAQSTRSLPQSSRAHSATNSMIEPFRIQLGAGEPFHFTAQVHPPPAASIGSPGRDGPVRSAYNAYTDYPDQPDFDGLPLPEWLHFDPRELEFWGIPGAADAGSVAVKVLQRKSYPAPGSPSKRRNSNDSKWSRHGDENEQVVGRFVLDVMDRRSVGSLGDVLAVSY